MGLSLTFLLTSCSKIETTDAKEVYQYWSGTELPKEIQLIKGAYISRLIFHLNMNCFLSSKRMRIGLMNLLNTMN